MSELGHLISNVEAGRKPIVFRGGPATGLQMVIPDDMTELHISPADCRVDHFQPGLYHVDHAAGIATWEPEQ